jgi:chromosome segregation ATPase
MTMQAVQGAEENTFDSTPHKAVQEMRRDLARADTDAAHAVDVRDELFEALMTVAEQMIDLDVETQEILVEVAKIRGLRDDMAQRDSQRLALEDRELRVEQSARQREGSLRFAVGDLSFDLRRTPARKADLEFQIQQLEQRLTELLAEAQRELDAITEEGIELAAAEARADDAWADAHRTLLGAVRAALVAAPAGEPVVMQLTLRAQAIHDAMSQLGAA